MVAPLLVRSNLFAALVLLPVPALMYALIALRAFSGDRSGTDFLSFWEAGRRVLEGQSPYPLVDALPAVVDRFTFAPFVYPAPAAYWLVPLAILPFALAKTLFLALNLGSVVLALRLLGVRDWRCHAVVFFSVPLVASAALGTFSPLLLLGVAAAWRYRDKTVRLGVIVAMLVVAKLFLWPLWLWLVYTRRLRAAVLSAVAGIAMTFVAWKGIAFAGLDQYPRLLSRMTQLVGANSYSPFALLHTAGLSASAAQGFVLAGGALIALLAAYLLRRDVTDERSFVVALGLALLLTPILWPHYLTLLYIPVALIRRSFSLLWLVPLLMWFDGDGWSDGNPARIIPFLLLCAIPFALVLWRDASERAEARRAAASLTRGPPLKLPA